MQQIINPEYLLCELPIKDESFNDQRQFIYCTKYLSLIEIFSEDDITVAFDKSQIQKQYLYEDESFLLVFTQNNVEMVNAHLNEIEVLKGNVSLKREMDILDEAWKFYEDYLKWEDNLL